MPAIDMTEIQKKYKGQWVAFAADEETVLASGPTLKEALKSARAKGHDDPIMTRMPEELGFFVG